MTLYLDTTKYILEQQKDEEMEQTMTALGSDNSWRRIERLLPFFQIVKFVEEHQLN